MGWIKLAYRDISDKAFDGTPSHFSWGTTVDGEIVWVFRDKEGNIGYMHPPAETDYDIGEILMTGDKDPL